MNMTAAGVAPRRALFGVSARTRDHILITLWFASTFKQFRNDELILYPIALYFAWAFVRDFDQLFAILRRSLIVFVIPVWWSLAAAWGEDSVTILRSGAQMTLTMIICYCAVLRLDRRQIIVSLLFSAGLFGVLSFLSEGTGGVAARGIFTSKNAMGAAMVILWVAALCTVLDKRFSLPLRASAFGLLALSARMIVVSNSATAQLLAIGITLVILVLGVLGGRGLGHPRFVVTVCLAGFAICLPLAFILATQEVEPVAKVLELFGKDAGLTGRTELWDYAMAAIVREPWLGVGPGGFWTPLDWTSDARRIHIDYHKSFYATFSFHNSYLEIAVHLGIVGLVLTLLKTVWLMTKVTAAALRDTSIPKVFFLAIGLVTLARSLTESGLMSPFSLMTMVLIMGALFAVKDQIARRDLRDLHH